MFINELLRIRVNCAKSVIQSIKENDERDERVITKRSDRCD